MQLICKPYIGDNRPRKDIEKIREAGFTASMLDVSVRCGAGEFEYFSRANAKRDPDKIYLSEQPEKLTEDVAKWLINPAREAGLPLPIAMSPFIPYKHPEWNIGREVNEVLLKLAAETVKAAVAAGCGSVIIHPLSIGIERGMEWEVNKEFYLKLAGIADELGSNIQILLCNMCLNINGHLVRGICADPEEACAWVDELNRECKKPDGSRFGFCFDLGSATLAGQDPYETMAPLGLRLAALIVRDLDGIHDSAMLPYTACVRGQQTDWLSFVRGARVAGFDGDLILDFSDTLGGTLELLRPYVMKLAYETGALLVKHLNIENVIKKHDSRVLFGAGNMCRAYMKCYGEEYPPLFTCDNNSTRWGEEFCGLTIESPEKLRELDPDTAIFLCNTYYKEIGDQIAAMNLPNPVEWFSDEYMPTFHMEKLPYAKVSDDGKITEGKELIDPSVRKISEEEKNSAGSGT